MEQVTNLLKNIKDLQRELKEKEKIIFNKSIELDVKENDIRIIQAEYREKKKLRALHNKFKEQDKK